MTPSRDAARLRLGLNPLTTSLGSPFNAQHNTPISAVSMSSSHLQSAQTPASSIQPYNPQEWVASPAAGSQSAHSQSTPDRSQQYAPTEPQAAPLPPPPYSPPRSQHQHQPPRPVSGVFDSPHALAHTPPVSRRPNVELHRPSPEPQANQSFPPPPGTVGREGSRDRRFRLPSLGRRRDRDDQSSQDHHVYAQSSRHSMGPGSFHAPEPIRPVSVASNVSSIAAPAARRAASAGAIETPTSARSRPDTDSRWDMAMGVPPPPPGPPPASSRSQSAQSVDRSTAPVISAPTRRPPPSGIASLGAVPPTPAGWVDSPLPPGLPPPRPPKERASGLTIDTTSAQAAEQAGEIPPSSSSAGGLNRAHAVRHDKTIIQRRAESRNGQSSRSSMEERTRPQSISDILVPAHSPDDATRRTRTTPRSAGLGMTYMDVPRTGESSGHTDSHNSTPRLIGTAKSPHPLDTETPPFSPFLRTQGGSSSVPPKALPTPPPQVRSASSSRPRDTSRPPAITTALASKSLMVSQSAEQFAAGTIERFQAFAAREAASATDADRVRLFADFIVNESRIRRERYSASIGAMGSEIFDLTRDLFRPMAADRRESLTSPEEWTPDSSEPNHSKRGSFSSNHRADNGASASTPTSGRLPPSPTTQAQGTGTWTSNYMPSLSPILSMSVSDRLENDSRGRPSSRWWESDSQGDPSRPMLRSKRESKYMGVSKDQWAETDQTATPYGTASEQGSSNDYPPEKTGLHDVHEEAAATPQPLRFSNVPMGLSPSPAPRGQDLVDVSRLVTLPPPYPRHHPAVNNNHPELTATRTCVRGLTDLTELETIKEKFALESSKRREEFTKAAAERRQSLRTNLQQEIGSGNLGYADAATIESDAQQQERAKAKDLEKAEYEQFQTHVIVPLNDILTARILTATELYDDLSRRLFDNEQNYADMPQEEGDDRPELLEKLTLLKWIFEARESLHRAIYDLLSDRNNRFREVVVTPYRLAGNTEKMKSAEAFFDDDAAKREYAFAIEVLNRSRDFRNVVDEAVQRGVALQLSAFWDIAPPLSSLLDNIPADLDRFYIQIPPSEFAENPSYTDHPLQYLFSLLLHTGKSTYQFIEAHTNLLCLLHEVKEAVVHAKVKVLQTQLEDEDGTPVCNEEREERAKTLLRSEEQRLTDELKEKVRVVQDQWNSALGEGLKQVKERVGEQLLQTGGWDETLEEDGALGSS